MKVAEISFVAPLLSVLLTLVAFSPIEQAEASENMTPLLLAVQDAPVPFMGSDGRVHLVYELDMNSFPSAEIAVEKVEVVSDGAVCKLSTLPLLPDASSPPACANQQQRWPRARGPCFFSTSRLPPALRFPLSSHIESPCG